MIFTTLFHACVKCLPVWVLSTGVAGRCRIRGDVLRRFCAFIGIFSLIAMAVAPASARASTTMGAASRAAVHRVATRPGLLSPGQALARARATRRAVPVDQMTTSSSLTTANPDGTFTVSESEQPVRAWRDGAWVALNPDLRRDAGGRLSPAVTTWELTLSDGGDGPLAVMTVRSEQLALSWPGRLPRPEVSGATATYRDVLPGVDLVVTVTPQGGFSDVLVVRNAAAAADPRLAHLQLRTARNGPRVTLNPAGVLSAGAGPRRVPFVTADAPRMWDSAAAPARAAQEEGVPASSSAAA